MLKVEDLKLTPAQKKVVEAFENAVYYYKSDEVNFNYSSVHIDGEGLYYELQGNAFVRRNFAYIIGENEYAYELSTSTIKSLAKKGVIDLEQSTIKGTGLDRLKVNIDFQKPTPKVYTNFTQVKAYTERYNSFTKDMSKVNHELVAPTEQIDELINKQWDESYTITSRTDFTATVHNFK